MKRRKILAVLLSLALVLGVFVPGTMSVSADPVESSSTEISENEENSTADVTEQNDEDHETVADDTEGSEAIVIDDTEDSDAIVTDESALLDSSSSDIIDSSENSQETSDSSSEEGDESSQTKEEFDAQATYDYLQILDSQESFDAYLDLLSDQEIFSLIGFLEEQGVEEDSLPYLTEYLDLRFPQVDPLTCQNDANVAPLFQRTLVRRLAAAAKTDSGVQTSKTVVKNADGSYKLRLEAYATGSSYTQVTQKPTDIVLVLDTSGSMDDYILTADSSTVSNLDPQYANYYMWYEPNSDRYLLRSMRYYNGYWQYCQKYEYDWWGNRAIVWNNCENSSSGKVYIKKIDALRIAVNGFLTSVKSQGGDNRVALVTYADDAYLDSGLTKDYDAIRAAVDNLYAYGATAADYGMQQAKTIFEGIPTDRDSNKVVIMFTDGEPNHYNGFDTKVANATISASKDMKGGGVTVYTIGVMSGADNTDTSSNFNRYMNYVSSNYPNATSMTNGGDRYQNPNGGGYYLTADNLQTLNEIFQNISSEVGGASNQTLNSESVIKDIVGESFQLPEGVNAGNIQVYTADCTAINNNVPTFGEDQASGLTAQIGDDGRTITVTGFDYSANYVGMNTTTGALHQPGKKLIVEIPITMRKGFLGGNQIPTNGDASGVYNGEGQSVQAFDVPNVDIDIQRVTVTASDKNVYLLGSLTLDQIKQGVTVKVGDVALSLTADNYGLEAWQNAYVDINVTYVDANGNTLTDLKDLKEDTTYKVTVTVSPKTNLTTANTKSGNGEGNINVFKPVLTYKDSIVYYGEPAPLNLDSNLVKTEWKHGGTIDTSDTMIGSAPELGKTYKANASDVADRKISSKKDIPISVQTSINNIDVTAYTQFLHQNCTDRTDHLPNGAAFLLHVNTCQLTLTKAGGAADEPYVFTILKDGNAYTQVSITGNGSKTVYELPVGTYSIEEDSGWSWRYQNTVNDSASLSSTSPSGSITCTNSKTKDKWLNGFSSVVQNILGKKQ